MSANGECEDYYIDGPTLGPTDPAAPLLILFHGWAYPNHAPAGTHDEHLAPIWDGHDLITWAVNKGWFVMMHDGGTVGWFADYFGTYGADRFQRATERAIAHASSLFKIDPNRIYGYGFSMGGEEVLAFAGRHLDPTGPMLAGVVTHSGYLSSIYQYIASGDQVGFDDTYGFPGPPVYYCSGEFAWRKANVLDLDETVIDRTGGLCVKNASTWPPGVADVRYWTSQAHNLAFLPKRSYYILNEVGHMIEVNELLEDWLIAHYGVAPYVQALACSSGCATNPPSNPPDCCAGTGCSGNTGVNHQWDTVCAADAVHFLEGRTRDGYLASVNGSVNRTLIAEDAKRYFHFEVTRETQDDFARIQWLFPSTNFLRMQDISADPNIAVLRIRADDAFAVLDPTNTTTPVKIRTNTDMRLEVKGYHSAPAYIVWKSSQGFAIVLGPNDVTFSGDTVSWNVPSGGNTYTIYP